MKKATILAPAFWSASSESRGKACRMANLPVQMRVALLRAERLKKVIFRPAATTASYALRTGRLPTPCGKVSAQQGHRPTD